MNKRGKKDSSLNPFDTLSCLIVPNQNSELIGSQPANLSNFNTNFIPCIYSQSNLYSTGDSQQNGYSSNYTLIDPLNTFVLDQSGNLILLPQQRTNNFIIPYSTRPSLPSNQPKISNIQLLKNKVSSIKVIPSSKYSNILPKIKTIESAKKNIQHYYVDLKQKLLSPKLVEGQKIEIHLKKLLSELYFLSSGISPLELMEDDNFLSNYLNSPIYSNEEKAILNSFVNEHFDDMKTSLEEMKHNIVITDKSMIIHQQLIDYVENTLKNQRKRKCFINEPSGQPYTKSNRNLVENDHSNDGKVRFYAARKRFKNRKYFSGGFYNTDHASMSLKAQSNRHYTSGSSQQSSPKMELAEDVSEDHENNVEKLSSKRGFGIKTRGSLTAFRTGGRKSNFRYMVAQRCTSKRQILENEEKRQREIAVKKAKNLARCKEIWLDMAFSYHPLEPDEKIQPSLYEVWEADDILSESADDRNFVTTHSATVDDDGVEKVLKEIELIKTIGNYVEHGILAPDTLSSFPNVNQNEVKNNFHQDNTKYLKSLIGSCTFDEVMDQETPNPPNLTSHNQPEETDTQLTFDKSSENSFNRESVIKHTDNYSNFMKLNEDDIHTNLPNKPRFSEISSGTFTSRRSSCSVKNNLDTSELDTLDEQKLNYASETTGQDEEEGEDFQFSLGPITELPAPSSALMGTSTTPKSNDHQSLTKRHWNYLGEEMTWLSLDFAQEHRWKIVIAKRVGRHVQKYFEEKLLKQQKVELEEIAKVKKIALSVSKLIGKFWKNIAKVAIMKVKAINDIKNQKRLDKQLNAIVGQTEEYSNLITQQFTSHKNSPPLPPAIVDPSKGSFNSTRNNHRLSSLKTATTTTKKLTPQSSTTTDTVNNQTLTKSRNSHTLITRENLTKRGRDANLDGIASNRKNDNRSLLHDSFNQVEEKLLLRGDDGACGSVKANDFVRLKTSQVIIKDAALSLPGGNLGAGRYHVKTYAKASGESTLTVTIPTPPSINHNATAGTNSLDDRRPSLSPHHCSCPEPSSKYDIIRLPDSNVDRGGGIDRGKQLISTHSSGTVTTTSTTNVPEKVMVGRRRITSTTKKKDTILRQLEVNDEIFGSVTKEALKNSNEHGGARILRNAKLVKMAIPTDFRLPPTTDVTTETTFETPNSTTLFVDVSKNLSPQDLPSYTKKSSCTSATKNACATTTVYDDDDDNEQLGGSSGTDPSSEDDNEEIDDNPPPQRCSSSKIIATPLPISSPPPLPPSKKSRKLSPSKESTNDTDSLNDIAAEAQKFHPKGYTLETTQVTTDIPFLLKHQLREYQHIGLDWLSAMYERKLNGILADEMGLGKTIQTISLLAHLACSKGIWGPHLIVVPTSVMLNWEMEFKKWFPGFKILTYYGSPKERRAKRKGWSGNAQNNKNCPNVVITSYRLVLQDERCFKRKHWHYFILDEAQNIKNFKSQRWISLLNFKSRARLLLTGTPLQNDLMEVWSLMHFLMPAVFKDSAQFSQWFARPLNFFVSNAEDFQYRGDAKDIIYNSLNMTSVPNNSTLAASTLSESSETTQLIAKLHKILRPFILRRLKKEVEKQMPGKFEHIVKCRLSKRQAFLYHDFVSRSSTQSILENGNFLGVINVLMQLRKVCNHPDLFEQRPVVSPFKFSILDDMHQFPRFKEALIDDNKFNKSHDSRSSPSNELMLMNTNTLRYIPSALTNILIPSKLQLNSILNSYCRLSPSSSDKDDLEITCQRPFNNIIAQGCSGGGHFSTLSNSNNEIQSDKNVTCKISSTRVTAFFDTYAHVSPLIRAMFLRPTCVHVKNDQVVKDAQHFRNYLEFRDIHSSFLSATRNDDKFYSSVNTELPHSLTSNQYSCNHAFFNSQFALAPTPILNRLLLLTYSNYLESLDPILKRFAIYIYPAITDHYEPHVSHHRPDLKVSEDTFKRELRNAFNQIFNPIFGPTGDDDVRSLLQPLRNLTVDRFLKFPERRLIEYDCGKLQVLKRLLSQLHVDKHRVLMFTQMTRVLDILESFLNYHGYRYLRLDGTTKIEQRQILMDRFNNDSKIFCFILSTRSGGLGINLTGADTVIFYDSDWNPTMDAQAQDRCHRIGQTRPVHIYRLISEYTVEESILLKARQKRFLADISIEEGNFTTAFFRKEGLKEIFSDTNNTAVKTDNKQPLSDHLSISASTSTGGSLLREYKDVGHETTMPVPRKSDDPNGVADSFVKATDRSEERWFEEALALTEETIDSNATRSVLREQLDTNRREAREFEFKDEEPSVLVGEEDGGGGDEDEEADDKSSSRDGIPSTRSLHHPNTSTSTTTENGHRFVIRDERLQDNDKYVPSDLKQFIQELRPIERLCLTLYEIINFHLLYEVHDDEYINENNEDFKD